MPAKLKTNGSSFSPPNQNSASNIVYAAGKKKIEVCQISTPTPIKKSLAAKPQKILPQAKRIKATRIKKGLHGRANMLYAFLQEEMFKKLIIINGTNKMQSKKQIMSRINKQINQKK